jgi:hypothetical protein
MYKNEVTGSPTIIGQLPLPAIFEITDLFVEPVNSEPNKNISISVKVINVGDVSGNYSIRFMLNGVLEGTKTLYLNEHSFSTISFEIAKDVEGIYFVEINNLKANFNVTALPAPEFEVSNISVSSAQVESGEIATISVRVENIGEKVGNYSVALTVNEGVEETKDITLEAGESAIISFDLRETVVGNYNVVINGLFVTFSVIEPSVPARFEMSHLELSPKNAEIADLVNISVTVSNVGEESGYCTVEAKVDSVIVDTKIIELNGGLSVPLNFTVSYEEVGTHIVEIGDLTASFTVSAPQKQGDTTFEDVIKIIFIVIRPLRMSLKLSLLPFRLL